MKKGKKFKEKRYDPVPKEYLSRSGTRHYSWKGKKVGYGALHEWIYKSMGRAMKCENCGIDKVPNGKKRWFHWANKSKQYKRDLNDWWQLCIQCHRKIDNWREKITIKFIESKCWEKRKRYKGKFL